MNCLFNTLYIVASSVSVAILSVIKLENHCHLGWLIVILDSYLEIFGLCFIHELLLQEDVF